MGNRGRGSNKIKALEPPNIKRPVPVIGMSEYARTIWKRIVKAYPADQFKPQHYDMLRMYCESAAINKIALANALAENYEKPYWLRQADIQAARCQGLGVKLGITVNNTQAARGKGGAAPKAKSKRAGLLYGGEK